MSRKLKNVQEFIDVLNANSVSTIWLAEVEFEGGEELKQVSDALVSNTSAAYVRFASNNMGDEALKAIVPGITGNQGIKRLEISNNQITTSGVTELCQGLQVNNHITRLDLTHNFIDDDGAGVIARLLEQNKSITDLNLSGNNIGLDGARLLLASFEQNFTLTKLKFKNRKLKASQEFKNVQKSIAEAIETNKKEQADRKKAAFDEAKNSLDLTGPWHRCKLMIIGEGMVGKTATVRSLVGEEFNEKWDSTIGVSLVSSKTSTWQNIPMTLEADGYTQVFAADRANELLKERQLAENTTLEEAWMMGYRAAKMGLGPEHPFKRKARLKEIKAELLVEKRRSARRGSVRERSNVPVSGEPLPPTKTSALPQKKPSATVAKIFEKIVDGAEKDDGIALTIWDYGGQEVFHALHHLFLTQYGIYVLVFDMRKLLKITEETKNYITFWLNSVKMHADEAIVLAVGTFKNELKPEQIAVVQDNFRELTKSYKQVLLNSEENLNFFPVDNKTKDGILSLKQVIKVEAKNLEFVNRDVNISWIKTLDAMMMKAFGKSWLSMKDAKTIAEGHLITSVDEVDRMLAFFHELGVLVHFEKTQALYDTIILYPQWLVQEISKVIRDGSIHKFSPSELRKLQLTSDLDQLNNFGLATVDLLEFFWGKEEAAFMLDLMRSVALLSDWNFGKETKYFIPSMVQKSRKKFPEIDGLQIIFDFSEFYLPNGVFERIVCSCVGRSSRAEGAVQEPIVQKEKASIWLEKDFRIYLQKNGEEVSVYTPSSPLASTTLRFLVAALNRIKQEVMTNLTWKVAVETEEGMVSFEKARGNAVQPWFMEGETSGQVKLSDGALDAFG